MKKTIAFTSALMTLGFMVALANAQLNGSSTNSQSTMPPTDQTAPPGEQQPGTVGETVAPSTCTDSSGLIYRQGQAGFDRCQEESGVDSDQPGRAGEIDPSMDPNVDTDLDTSTDMEVPDQDEY